MYGKTKMREERRRKEEGERRREDGMAGFRTNLRVASEYLRVYTQAILRVSTLRHRGVDEIILSRARLTRGIYKHNIETLEKTTEKRMLCIIKSNDKQIDIMN